MAVSNFEHERLALGRYNHAHWAWRRKFLRFLIQSIGLSLLVKLDSVEGLENVPSGGPAIIMINHIAFVDPIMVLQVLPRFLVPLAKIEVYRYPLVGIFPRMWGVIPVRREEVDRRALQQALDVLKAGEIILLAPEGHRGPALQQGKEGVAFLAVRSDAPIVPAAVEGTPGFPALRFISPRWKQPGVHIRFGRPFRYREAYRRPSREQLRLMTDEAMYQLAALLPPARRGLYADPACATQTTLEWLV